MANPCQEVLPKPLQCSASSAGKQNGRRKNQRASPKKKCKGEKQKANKSVPKKGAMEYRQLVNDTLQQTGQSQLFLDLFAGTGIVGQKVRALGMAAVSLDICDGWDLTEDSLLKEIEATIFEGKVFLGLAKKPSRNQLWVWFWILIVGHNDAYIFQ